MSTTFESLTIGAEENYHNFFWLYKKGDYSNALVSARRFVEYIAKAGIYEICHNHYNDTLFQFLEKKDWKLIQHKQTKGYYTVKTEDIENAQKGVNSNGTANGSILKGNRLELSQIGYNIIQESFIFNFESSGLIKIFGAFIEQINQNAYYKFKTSNTYLSDLFYKANPGAHSSSKDELQKAAQDVNLLLQPCTLYLLRFCEEYASIFLCDTAILLKELVNNTERTISSSAKTPSNRPAQQNRSYNGYSKQPQNATADINKHKEEELRRQKEEDIRKRQEKKQKEDNELEQAFYSLLADYNSQQEEGPEKRQEETEKDKRNYADDSQMLDELLSALNEIDSRHLCRAYIDGKWGYINKSGEWVIKPQFEEAQVFKSIANSDNKSAPVRVDRKWGCIDRAGNWIIPPKYDEICHISEGWIVCRPLLKKHYYVSTNGGELLNNETFDDVKSFSEGLASVKKTNGKYGFVDKTGKFVIQPQFDYADSFSEGLAKVEISGKWGFIDKTGKFVIQPQFDDVANFSEGLAKVKTNGKFGFIDKTGKIVAQPQFVIAESFSEGLARVKDNKNTYRYGYIDKTGKFSIQPQFIFAGDFSEGLANVKINGKWGFIDKTGKIVAQPQFDDVESFSEGLAGVEINGKWGFIDKTGKIVIQPQFEYVGSFHDITKSQEHFCFS